MIGGSGTLDTTRSLKLLQVNITADREYTIVPFNLFLYNEQSNSIINTFVPYLIRIHLFMQNLCILLNTY